VSDGTVIMNDEFVKDVEAVVAYCKVGILPISLI